MTNAELETENAKLRDKLTIMTKARDTLWSAIHDRQKRLSEMGDKLTAALKREAELVEALMLAEWDAWECCPVCYREKGEGHAEDCELALVLKRYPQTRKESK